MTGKGPGSLKHRVAAVLGAALRLLNIALILASALATVIRRRRALLGFDNIVVYSDGGYGHTIIGPDMCRRLWPQQRSALLFINKPGIYNRLIAEVFPDTIALVFITEPFSKLSRLSPFVQNLASPTAVQRVFIAEALRRLLRLLVGAKRTLTYLELYTFITPLRGSTHINPAYLALWSREPQPPLTLRPALREAAARQLGVTPADRLCAIYLRDNFKGAEDSRNRAGGAVADYLPTIDWLVGRGYRVLICGDRGIDPALAARHPGALGDAATWNIDRDLFALYAATAATVFIAEAGGGFWLPAMACIPTLLTNHFPIGTALPGTTVLYKRMLRADGTAIPPAEALRDFNAVDEIRHLGITLIDNTPEELLMAAQDFVTRAEAGLPPPAMPAELRDICDRQAATMMLANSGGAGLSPVWLADAPGRDRPA